jgi:hypothetical protein
MRKTAIISDKRLRAKLIASAEYIENSLANGSMDENQNLQIETPYGLRITAVIETREGKPDIFYYTYSMNLDKLNQWAQSVKYLLEGPLIFMGYGVEIFVPEGLENLNKTMVKFETRTLDQREIPKWTNPFKESIVFRVHREIVNQKEWEIFYDSAN